MLTRDGDEMVLDVICLETGVIERSFPLESTFGSLTHADKWLAFPATRYFSFE
jgi:hypothetical protein